jgi:predicted ATP-dependent serine protease
MQLHLPKDFVIIGFIPYWVRLKGASRPPQPVAKARTSAEAVRTFAKEHYCPRGSVVQVFTPESLIAGRAVFEHRLKEYRKPRLRG